MSTTVNLGRIRCMPKGEYSSTKAYEFLDIVTKNGSSYIAMTIVPAGKDVTDTNYWQLIASKGEQGDIGPQGVQGIQGETGPAGKIISMKAEIYDGIYGTVTPTVLVTTGGTASEREYTLRFNGIIGNGIQSITSKQFDTLIKQYNITYTNGKIYSFVVSDGNGIYSITKDHSSKLLDFYKVTYTNGSTGWLYIRNGRGIKSIAKTSTSGIVDTYTITYNDGSTSTFEVTNGSVQSVGGKTGDINAITIETITAQDTTLGSIKTTLDTATTNNQHIIFDVSALGTQMGLCYVSINDNVCKITDVENQLIVTTVYNDSTLLTSALVMASQIATQAQIDTLQQEIDELGGKSTIKNWETLAALIESGESTNYISAGDTIDINWIRNVSGTIASGATVKCTNFNTFGDKIGEAEATTYRFVYDGTNWNYNNNTVNLSEYALTVTGTPVTGDVMSIDTVVEPINFTFVGYDNFTPHDSTVSHNWCLESTYVLHTEDGAVLNSAWDSTESILCVLKGKTIPAGNYSYICKCGERTGSSKLHDIYVYFTISADLHSDDHNMLLKSESFASNADVRDTSGNKVTAYVTDKVVPMLDDYTTTLDTSVSIHYTPKDGVTYTDLTTLNTDDNTVFVYNDFSITGLGKNVWELSNARQWLNSDKPNGEFTPTHINDWPSVVFIQKHQGFLYGMDKRVKDIIVDSDNTYRANPTNPTYTSGTMYTCTDKIFKLTMHNMSYNINDGGNVTDLYSKYCGGKLTNTSILARLKYTDSTLSQYARRTSSQYNDTFNIYSVYSANAIPDAGGAANSSPTTAAFLIGKASS